MHTFRNIYPLVLFLATAIAFPIVNGDVPDVADVGGMLGSRDYQPYDKSIVKTWAGDVDEHYGNDGNDKNSNKGFRNASAKKQTGDKNSKFATDPTNVGSFITTTDNKAEDAGVMNTILGNADDSADRGDLGIVNGNGNGQPEIYGEGKA